MAQIERLVVLGGEDAAERARRAGETWAKYLPPPTIVTEGSRPQAEGLLEGVFGDLLVGRVRGTAGGRSRLHKHSSDQILITTSGIGIIATEREEYRLTPGSVVLVPAGELHLHGSAADTGHETVFITKVPYSTEVIDEKD